MKNILLAILISIFGAEIFAQELITLEGEKSLASYDDFKNLVAEVEQHREERLIDLETFLEMSQEENVVLLDTRSAYFFKRKRLKGAINLDFTEFTQASLNDLIPDPNTKILIYCNNNFKDDQTLFPTKSSGPSASTVEDDEVLLPNQKPIMLALNIPTYINLYGYGYRNVYELGELVSVYDTRIEFEGRKAN